MGGGGGCWQRPEQSDSHSGKVIGREQRLELMPGPSQKLGQGRQLLLLGDLADKVYELREAHVRGQRTGPCSVRQCDHPQPNDTPRSVRPDATVNTANVLRARDYCSKHYNRWTPRNLESWPGPRSGLPAAGRVHSSERNSMLTRAPEWRRARSLARKPLSCRGQSCGPAAPGTARAARQPAAGT